jgi:hypothetical protein
MSHTRAVTTALDNLSTLKVYLLTLILHLQPLCQAGAAGQPLLAAQAATWLYETKRKLSGGLVFCHAAVQELRGKAEGRPAGSGTGDCGC